MNTKISSFAVALVVSMSLSAQSFQKNADVAGDTLHLIGHSHMDMNWLWTLSETQKMANDNLRQAVALPTPWTTT